MIDSPFRAIKTEPITIDNTLGGVRLTLTTVRGLPRVERVELHVESAPLRWQSDGTAPTATTGTLQNPTDIFTLNNRNDIENFRAIRSGGTSATLVVTYYAL